MPKATRVGVSHLLKYIEDRMDHSLFDRFTNIYVGRVMLDKTPDDDPHESISSLPLLPVTDYLANTLRLLWKVRNEGYKPSTREYAYMDAGLQRRSRAIEDDSVGFIATGALADSVRWRFGPLALYQGNRDRAWTQQGDYEVIDIALDYLVYAVHKTYAEGTLTCPMLVSIFQEARKCLKVSGAQIEEQRKIGNGER